MQTDYLGLAGMWEMFGSDLSALIPASPLDSLGQREKVEVALEIILPLSDPGLSLEGLSAGGLSRWKIQFIPIKS